jgi:long-subunit acyl-CoA synthetase (AMP-forming)
MQQHDGSIPEKLEHHHHHHQQQQQQQQQKQQQQQQLQHQQQEQLQLPSAPVARPLPHFCVMYTSGSTGQPAGDALVLSDACKFGMQFA